MWVCIVFVFVCENVVLCERVACIYYFSYIYLFIRVDNIRMSIKA